MLLQHVFDFARTHAVGTHLDHVVPASHHEQTAVGIGIPQVARAVTLRTEPLGGLVRPVPVATCDVRPASHEFSDFARCRDATILGEDTHLDAGYRATDGTTLGGQF